MQYEEGFQGVQREEIEGAPPANSREELLEQRLSETVTVNRYLYLQTRQLEYMLLETPDLQALLEVLLVSMPRHFGFGVAELWLYDPEEVLAGLIANGHRYGPYLQLHSDAFRMQELYELEPDITLIDATDPRMFEVLKSEHGVNYALLLPLLDAGRMIGSLHLGLQDDACVKGKLEEDLVAHVAAIVSRCFMLAVSRQQVSQLTLLDPLTQIGNLRGFERDIAREIARARRAEQPLSVLVVEIDDYDDLYENYGTVRAQFVVKKVAQRIFSGMRATDLLARLDRARLAVLIPGSCEMLGREIGERMRTDIESFAIDDGRGAVLQVTVSIGMVTWAPQHFPAVDMPQLARQMKATGAKALEVARTRGGNQVALSRLSTLLV